MLPRDRSSRTSTPTPSTPSTLAARADTTEAEAALVRDMLLGSRVAWREFHTRYARLIYRCIGRVTARFSMRMSQDDTAEIYATLLVQLCSNEMAKLRGFDAERGRRLSSWIGLLAVNCAYDHLRALRSEPRRASLDECEHLGAEGPLPDEVLDFKERAALAREILRDFSEKDREFVALYFGEGLAVEQIAERMRISIKTVYSKKHKIQSRIEARLSGMRLPAHLPEAA
jgi:RNA polymerase sigma-70 factor (ECF subfamily)